VAVDPNIDTDVDVTTVTGDPSFSFNTAVSGSSTTITYSAIDAFGNTSVTTRNVTVVDF